MLAVDWTKVFEPAVPVLETFVRGTLIYLFIVVVLRVILKRGTGNLTLTDVLMIVLLGDASQNGMAANHEAVTDSMVLIGTILFWDWLLDWLAYHVKPIGDLLHPKPVSLIDNGRLNRRNMRKELVSEDELLTQARLNGVEELRKIKHAYIEGDGSITILSDPQGGGGGQGTSKKDRLG